MKTHRWLHKRGAVYYMRAIVPRELIAYVGKREIWLSLGTSRKHEAMQRIKLPTEDVERVLETIRNAANTDKIGDGKIFVLEVAEAMRIRTGETGSNAL